MVLPSRPFGLVHRAQVQRGVEGARAPLTGVSEPRPPPKAAGSVHPCSPPSAKPDGELRATMSLENWSAAVDADRKARTRAERHGAGELTLWDDLPLSAKGCLLPDGTMTDADCLVPGTAISSDAARVWTRRLPGTALRRRGRVAVETETALRFVDEPAADAPACSGRLEPKPPTLERDLGASARIRTLVRSDLFAALLYGALCNTQWKHTASGAEWSAVGDALAALWRLSAVKAITWTGIVRRARAWSTSRSLRRSGRWIGIWWRRSRLGSDFSGCPLTFQAGEGGLRSEHQGRASGEWWRSAVRSATCNA